MNINVGMNANDLYKTLEDYFNPKLCTDIFKIGLQYNNTDFIKKIYTSTFASVDVLKRVLDKNENDIMIFSHHPVPQKPDENSPYPEIPLYLVEKLKESRISLFSYHIPLDGHNLYSPSYSLALALGLKPYDTFYFQNGIEMGELCESTYSNINEVVIHLEHLFGHAVRLYNYGDEEVKNKRIAIVAGCAKNPDMYEYLYIKGINTFITGVTNKEITWTQSIHEQAKVNGINLIGGTHFSTEKFALISLVKFFEGLGIPCEFLDELPNLNDI
jgi:putative NIF3 family GTP cyclohydrolase 1 type 2